MISNSHVRARLCNGCTPTENQVHVWRSGLDCPPDDLDGLLQILSLDERERADRFRFVADRMQYVIGRSLLRILLGHCLAIPARTVSFEYGAAGKPYLAAGNYPSRVLNFNVSHSGDVVLVALAYNRAIGIDAELVRSDFETGDIAEQFFFRTRTHQLG